ncbi:hypothetical protein DS745_12000 [Anaerobacillus alkaliphilus]|uniref:Uncharacterized protein n=1 Tax=Anaerobacillus alkaliphilus TaxID=1548597 RepID=A0A4Q0VRN7_9BACI|nr:DUF6407 family protein [Anaerobacillus alkaliphilus]RXJ00250.1 hypothetical protein DS745_12000 [Anaerobacillus alkaliphilus]
MTLRQFVLEKIRNMENFDAKNRNSIKEVIRLAIEDFRFKSKEKSEVLYLASNVEENLLSKIAEFALGSEEETSIESIYEGYVIVRKY